jgi:hypothetical protein
MVARPRLRKVHPALKHAAYSTTTILPGEDRAAFEELHQELLDEYEPEGISEIDVIADLAHLTWRKRNVGTYLITKRARARFNWIQREWNILSDPLLAKKAAFEQEAAKQAREELGHTAVEVIDDSIPPTTEFLFQELEIRERLDHLIDRCLNAPTLHKRI